MLGHALMYGGGGWAEGVVIYWVVGSGVGLKCTQPHCRPRAVHARPRPQAPVLGEWGGGVREAKKEDCKS